MERQRGRFAPSPSGALHLGSARTALASAVAARAAGGAWVLRVEDLDAARVAHGATEALLNDLTWLGLAWDEGPGVGGDHEPYAQSGRTGLYRAALEVLKAQGWVYPCACSRREVDLAAQAPHGAEPVYPGLCRGRDAQEVIRRAEGQGRGVAWRFAVPPGAVTVHDAAGGAYTQNVECEVGDFVVYRADGVPAYQLAVVVDDIAMEVTQVVRGGDLLSSTPRQVLLYRAFGATPPTYLHVPLVLGDDGVRLAKRHGSISIAALRERGVAPERLRRALLDSLGIEEEGARDGRGFDPARIPRSAVTLAQLRRAVPQIE